MTEYVDLDDHALSKLVAQHLGYRVKSWIEQYPQYKDDDDNPDLYMLFDPNDEQCDHQQPEKEGSYWLRTPDEAWGRCMPPFASDMSYAWQLLDILKDADVTKDGFFGDNATRPQFTMQYFVYEHGQPEWIAGWYQEDSGEWAIITEPSLPRALCKLYIEYMEEHSAA